MIGVHAAVIKQKGLGPEHVANVVGVAASAMPTAGKESTSAPEVIAPATSIELDQAQEDVTATPAPMDPSSQQILESAGDRAAKKTSEPAAGTSSAEPLALQVVARPKRSSTASGSSSAQPGDLHASATASIVGKSLEDALDKMYSVYTTQHQGVKSLIQVIHCPPFSIVHLYSPAPKCQIDSWSKGFFGTCSSACTFFLQFPA